MLLVKRLSENAILPKRGSELAAGYDLASAESKVVPAHGKALVKTDLSIATPLDCYARIGKDLPSRMDVKIYSYVLQTMFRSLTVNDLYS